MVPGGRFIRKAVSRREGVSPERVVPFRPYD